MRAESSASTVIKHLFHMQEKEPLMASAAICSGGRLAFPGRPGSLPGLKAGPVQPVCDPLGSVGVAVDLSGGHEGGGRVNTVDP